MKEAKFGYAEPQVQPLGNARMPHRRRAGSTYADLVTNGTFIGPGSPPLSPGGYTTLNSGSTLIPGWTVTLQEPVSIGLAPTGGPGWQ